MNPPWRPMVLVHGWGCPINYWDRLTNELTPNGQSITRFVAPGYDGVEIENWTFARAAQKLIDTVEILDDGPVHLVAHSMGMFIVGEAIRKRPDIANNIALIGGVPTPPAGTGVNPAVEELLATGALKDRTVQACMRSWYLESHERRNNLDSVLREISPAVLIDSARACTGAPPCSSWDTVNQPVHVITGSLDQTRTPAQIRDFVGRVPNRKWTVIPGSGHMAHWTHPEDVARALNCTFSPTHHLSF